MITRKPELIKIGETYLKFNFEYTESNRNFIKEIYLKQVGSYSNEILRNKEFLKISIEYDEGSIKTRIIVWGTAIYMGIANYGSFRNGIREIINDSKLFSEFVIERIDNDPNIEENNIIRIEKRTGLPGRIQELYKRIDKLEKNINNLSNNQIQEELQQIKQEIANIITFLPDIDCQTFLDELGNDYTQNLPLPDNKRINYLMNRYALKPDDEIEFIDE